MQQIPSRLEPSGLHHSDGKCPDGVTMTPWSEGKFLVWDATCVDTFCESYKHKCASECGAAAAHAEGEKAGKYSSFDRAYSFQPIAIETSGSVGPSTMSFLRVFGHRLKTTTGEPQFLAFLLQRLSVAIQTGNAISVSIGLPWAHLLTCFISKCVIRSLFMDNYLIFVFPVLFHLVFYCIWTLRPFLFLILLPHSCSNYH